MNSVEIPNSITSIGNMAFYGIGNELEIIVRGKTEAPSGFSTTWNCIETDTGMDDGNCTKYAKVTYRP